MHATPPTWALPSSMFHSKRRSIAFIIDSKAWFTLTPSNLQLYAFRRHLQMPYKNYIKMHVMIFQWNHSHCAFCFHYTRFYIVLAVFREHWILCVQELISNTKRIGFKVGLSKRRKNWCGRHIHFPDNFCV